MVTKEERAWRVTQEGTAGPPPPGAEGPPPEKPLPPSIEGGQTAPRPRRRDRRDRERPTPLPPSIERGETAIIQPTVTEKVKIPSEAERVESTAEGRPAVFKHKEEKYYAPASTMAKMGFKTHSEYIKAQRLGASHGPHEGTLVPKDSILVEWHGDTYRFSAADLERKGISRVALSAVKKGKYKVPVTKIDKRGHRHEVFITASQGKKLAKLEGRKWFDYSRTLGLIPRGSKYVGVEAGGVTFSLPGAKKTTTTLDAGKVDRATTDTYIISRDLSLVTKHHPLNEFVEDGKLNVTEAIRAGHTHIGDYRGYDMTGSELKKLVTEYKEREAALKVLEDKGYKGYGNRYRVVDALVSDDPEVTKALGVVFTPKDIKSAETWIERNWGAHGRFIAGKQVPFSVETQKALRKVTPWQEEKGETLLSYLQGLRERVPFPSPLAAAVPAVTVTPSKLDDALLWVIAGGAITATAIKVAIAKVPDDVKEATATFRSSFKRSPAPEDLVLISPQLLPYSVATLPRFRESIEIVKPKEYQEGVKVAKEVPKLEGIKVVDKPRYQEGVRVIKEAPYIYLPTPKVSEKVLGDLAQGVMKASAAVAVAEVELKRALPKVTTIPIDYEKILREAQEAKKKEDIARAFATIDRIKLSPAEERHYRTAYEEYLRKMAILAEARRQYILSLNPTPMKGKISDDAVGVFAAYMLGQSQKLEAPRAGEALGVYVRRVVGSELSPVVNTATTTALKTYTEAITDGNTATQAATKTLTTVQNQVNTALSTSTVTRTLTQTQVKQLARVIAKAATATAIRTATATRVITPAMARTATATATATPALAVATPVPIPLPRGGTDKEKRERIKKAGGAVGWKQGELRGQAIYHVLMYPYKSRDDYVTVVGAAPIGAAIATGKGSAYRTIRKLYGRAPARKVLLDMGIEDVAIIPKGRGVGIQFTPDPRQETRGDIQIGNRIPLLDRRKLMPGRKPIRITPKRPRLRR